MSSYLSKSLEKQGIVSILGSDHDCYERAINRAKVTSMRRTLSSTEMSSKKWKFDQHGFSSMKKISSSEDLSMSFVDANKEKEDYDHQGGKNEPFDIWSSIVMSTKANNNDISEEIPPYVHPLVKRSSTSSLSEKSLEICTENLGSETGSDGFSSYPASEISTDNESDQKEEEHHQQEEKVLPQSLFYIGDHQDQYCITTTTTRAVVKYNYAASNKKLSPKFFPPPLQTLSQSDGASIQMRTHRDNGRLVLQAESLPLLKKNFSAQRQTGRLVLTFLENNITHHDFEELNYIQEAIEEKKIDVEEFDEDFGEDEEKEREIGDEEDEEESQVEEGAKENRSREINIVIMDQRPKITTARLTSVHRLALKVNKPFRLANRLNNNKFNDVVKFDQGLKKELVEEKPTPLPKSLPPRPPVGQSTSSTPGVAKAAGVASFNAYEYYWRENKSTQHISKDKGNHKLSVSNDQIMVNNQQQQMVVYRGHKDESLVPLIKCCKEQRRSLLWEPYCVATS